jgi:hypothetical protein
MTEHEKHRSLDDEERTLEREMTDLETDEKRTKLEIEAEVLKEHWGHDPERPLQWERKAEDDR